MEWLPAASADWPTEALPLTRLYVPSGVAPSMKVTEPVGAPLLPATVAVNVTA